jgi:hypothetical protein
MHRILYSSVRYELKSQLITAGFAGGATDVRVLYCATVLMGLSR